MSIQFVETVIYDGSTTGKVHVVKEFYGRIDAAQSEGNGVALCGFSTSERTTFRKIPAERAGAICFTCSRLARRGEAA